MRVVLNSFKGFERVFSRVRFLILFLVVALVFYVFNVLIINFTNLRSVYGLLGIQGMLNQFFISFVFFYETLPLEIYINMIILSLLTGFLVSMLVYRWMFIRGLKRDKKGGWLAGIGLFLGVIAPGCASCGIGLIAAFGLTASIASLPFQGSEVTWIATIILIISVFIVAEKIGKGFICDIPGKPHVKNIERRSNRKR